MEELTQEQLENIRKRQELEHAVMFSSPAETAEIYRNIGSVDMSARALSLACRFRGVEWVKALVECGAGFVYDYREVNLPESRCFIWYMIDFSLGLLRFSDTVKNGFYSQANLNDWCFPDLYKSDDTTYEVLPLEERLKCLDYLITAADKAGFDIRDFYFKALIANNLDMAEALKQRGIKLTDEKISMLTETAKETQNSWYECCCKLMYMTDEEFYSVISAFVKEVDGKKIRFSTTIYWNMIGRLYKRDFFKFMLENFDQSKMNRIQMLRDIVDGNYIGCLPIVEEHGWLKLQRRRDEIIKYASDNNKVEITAWLMDFKNRTADLAAEREKADKKLMRELNADPNSVSELSKIWSYKKQEDGTLIITSYKSSSTAPAIPEKIGRQTVTAIGDYACSPFQPRAVQKITQLRYHLTKLTIPNTVTYIGEMVFQNCISLEEVNIPDGITVIKNGTFWGCKKLKSIKIPDSVKIIEPCAFYLCESLPEIIIPDGVTEIGNAAFAVCRLFKSIELPPSVQKIGLRAFTNCNNLERISLPNGITEIKMYTFEDCDKLQSIEIPNTVESIGECAFSGCKSLKSVEIPESVTTIGKRAFSYCDKLETVKIPASVKQIKNQTSKGKKPQTVFHDSPNVTAIVEPKSYAEKYCKHNEIPYRYAEI